jgi:glycosyltransferase involved in cell wall biosynthesis
VNARRRILVVAYYFPPLGGGGVNRTLKVVKRLCDAGWKPIVLTVDDAAWMRDETRLSEVPETVQVLRLPNPDWGRVAVRLRRAGTVGSESGRGHGRLRRLLVPDLNVGWSLLATPVVGMLALGRSIDAVYTTAPPYSANAPGLAARVLGVPWIADFRDGWTCCPTRADFSPRRIAFERRLEDRVLRNADRVLFTSSAVRNRCTTRIPSLADRSDMLLTGYDADDFREGRDMKPPADRLEIVHAGSVFAANRGPTLDKFLAAVRQLISVEPEFRRALCVRFLGAEPGTSARIGSQGLTDLVRVEPAVPRARVGNALRRAHICLALSPPGSRGGDPIPGKLFDASGAGRPILALTGEGALARLIRRHGLGVAIPPEDSAGIAALIHSALRRVRRSETALPFDESGARELESGRCLARVVEIFESVIQVGERACPSASAW